MPVHQSFGEDPFSQRQDFVDVVPRDHRIDVHFEPASELRLQAAQNPGALDRLVEIAGHAAHRVVRVGQAVERDVDVQIQIAVSRQATVGDFINPGRFQAIRR